MDNSTMWNRQCRACLSTKETFTYLLFSNVSPETYTFCTSIEIFEDEDLPKALCNDCHEQITKYAKFKETCLQSQNVLLSLCKSIETSHKKKEEEIKLEPQVSLQVDFERVKLEDGDDKYDEIPLIDKFSDDETLENQTGNEHWIPRKPKMKKNLQFSCGLCSKMFGNTRTYEAHHKKEHSGEKVLYPCQQCDKTFETWSGIQRHTESKHLSIRLARLACHICGRVCASRQSLRAHQKAHGARQMLMCHQCGLNVTSQAVLKKHLETHSSNRERLHTCEHCGKKFYTHTTLVSHILRQHTNRRYICDYCQHPFTEKYNLIKHIQIHTGLKNYQCGICSKSFGRSASLIEHKRIHSGEKPFICSFCPKSFLSKRRLRDHARTHTGERPYKCDICHHSFTQRGSLQRHVRRHGKTKDEFII